MNTVTKNKKQKQTKAIDVQLLMVVLILVVFGVVMIFSASAVMASERYHDAFFFLKRQLMWVSIGLVAMMVAANIEYRIWQKYSFAIALVSLVLVALVLVPHIGVSVGGARRWFRLGFIGFQPSEFAKLALIMYTASWLDRKQSKIKKGVLVYVPHLLLVGLTLGLIYKEPDLGTTVLLFLVLASMHFVGGIRLRYMVALFLAALPGLYYAILSKPYRRQRLLSFLDPWANARGTGYQIVQSFLALGSGGIFGAGIGASKLKLLYLPEAHTDFIYPIIAEELGIAGSLGVIALFTYFCFRGIRVSVQSPDFFGKILAFAITVVIVYQGIINIGVTTGLLPTKGMPLPFISFGGSSLVMTLFAVGVLLNISKYRMEKGQE